MNDQVAEILTRENLSDMLNSKEQTINNEYPPIEQRRAPHWLADGTIEFWPADENWSNPWHAKCRNISRGGMGMSSNHYLDEGANIGVALHFDETCFHGKAVVRYCEKVRDQFMIGAEFVFDD